MDKQMSLTVPQEFSVFDLVDWQNVRNIFIKQRPMLAYYCKQIELQVVEHGSAVDVYAGFQRLVRVKPVLPRYRQMADNGANVAVFGQPGEGDPSLTGMRRVVLNERNALIHEWFLVARHPDFNRALIALEIGEPDWPHEQRTFRGVLTSDDADIARIADTVEKVLSGS